MAWQPSAESLQTLAVYLKDSLSGFDKAAQKKAELVRGPLYSQSTPEDSRKAEKYAC